MAQEIKISALVDSLVLDGTESVAIVQGGTTVKATTQQIANLYTAPTEPKKYKALLACSGGIITATILLNTLGDGTANGTTDIAWSNPSNGLIRATMTSAPFVSAKTFYLVNGVSFYFSSVSSPVASLLNIALIKFDGTQTATPNFTKLCIEIEIYN